MTDTIETTEDTAEGTVEAAGTPQEPQDAPEAAQDAAEDAGEPQDAADGRKGEARLRKRAQAAEAQVADLTGQLEALRRQVAEGAIHQAGFKPDAVAAALDDGDLTSLFGDDGNLDQDMLGLAIETARDRFGLEAPVKMPAPNPAQGTSGSGPATAAGPTWQGLLSQR